MKRSIRLKLKPNEPPEPASEGASTADLSLIFKYLEEQYAAARHQQTMRLQSIALMTSASALIFIQGVVHHGKYFVPTTFGVTLVLLGLLSKYFNRKFHKANRYHVEIAKRTRDTIAEALGGSKAGEIADPNLIGKAVRQVIVSGGTYEEAIKQVRADPEIKSKFKLETELDWVLNLLPFATMLAGVLLILSDKGWPLVRAACYMFGFTTQ